MANSPIKHFFRVLLVIGIILITYMIFHDGILYLIGKKSNIGNLDLRELTFQRVGQLPVKGRGGYDREVKLYTSTLGEKIAVYDGGSPNQLYIKGHYWLQEENNYKKIITYDPFFAWRYLLLHGAAWLIAILILFSLIGGLLKICKQM